MLQYNALVKSVKLMMTETEHALRLSAALEAEVNNIISDQKTEDQWEKVPQYVGNLDKGWQAQWIVAHDTEIQSTTPLTREFLDTLESKDPKVIANLLQLFTATTPYTELPDERKASRSLCGKLFSIRATNTGDYMKNWRHKYCTPNGIDLKKGAAYQLTFTEGFRTRVTYRNSAIHVDINSAECIVTPAFQMKDPLSIQNCMVYKGMSKSRLVDLFDLDPDGPKHMLGLNAAGKKQKRENPLQAIVTQLQSAKDEAKTAEQQASFEESTDFVGKIRKDRMAATLKAASERAQESAKRRRTLDVA